MNGGPLQLSHFTVVLVFSFFISIVFGITQKDAGREQVRYGVKCFVWFVVGVLAAGWAMWMIRR
jgi:hypothetical protein